MFEPTMDSKSDSQASSQPEAKSPRINADGPRPGRDNENRATAIIPKLQPGVELLPIDSLSTSQMYLAKLNGRHYEISTALYHFIRLIDGNKTIQQIAAAFADLTNKDCSPADAERIIETYLMPRGLMQIENGSVHLSQLYSYLYVRIPLLSQQFLRPITQLLHFLFAPSVMLSALTTLAAFHSYFYLFAQRPPVELGSITGGDLIAVYGLFLLSTLFHELGHSSACHHYGARHGPIGVGLYLYFPVFYADVTDVWRLKRFQRAVVDSGGMYFQLLFVPILYGLFVATENHVFVLTIYALNCSIVTSLNPLFRFDGYWLASDLAGIPNLRKRAQETLRSLIGKLLKPRSAVSLPALQLRPGAKYFLYSYELVSNLFFAFFIYHIIIYLPGLVGRYPALVHEFIVSLPRDIAALNFGAIFEHLSGLLFPTLVIFMMVMMLYRVLSRPFRNLSKLLFRKTVGAVP